MRHVLVSSEDPELAARIRALAPASTVILSIHGEDATLERLGRSARLDAVVTDDASIEEAIRREIPGSLPVLVAGPGEDAASLLARLSALVAG